MQVVPSALNSTKPLRNFVSEYKKLAGKKNGRILVVDDEEFCISSMESILRMAGLDVEQMVDFCINGEEAVKQVIESYQLGITYALVLTDFSMPVLNGIEATKKIRKVLKEEFKVVRANQPVIVGITGHV